ncbi:MAG: hypothetical protein ABH878_01210 [bacterium]
MKTRRSQKLLANSLIIGLIVLAGCLWQKQKLEEMPETAPEPSVVEEPAAFEVSPILDGAVPSAMQWKKAGVLAAVNGGSQNFHSWLKELPESPNKIWTFAGNNRDSESLRLYLLLGWSPSGADEMRRAGIDSVRAISDQINIYLSRPTLQVDGSLMGTADMRFVGWEISLEDLSEGLYQANLLQQRQLVRIKTMPFSEETIGEGNYEKIAELKFQIGGGG